MKSKNIAISLNMTYNCNLKCDYCIETTRNEKENINLKIDEAILFIDKFINDNNYERIKIEFFGGEPTLKRKQIMEFLYKIKDKPYFNLLGFRITTNGFIYFEEFIEFMKENKIDDFFINISYDFYGQYKRTKNPTIIKIIENNIFKYKEALIRNNFSTNKIMFSSCLVEENCDKIFEYFKDSNFKFGLQIMSIVPVFPEYWKKESFKKMYNNFECIYNYIINTQDENLSLPNIKFPFINISEKHNTIKNGTNVLSFDKLDVLPLKKEDKDNKYHFHQDDRGSIKKRYKIHQEILELINLERNVEINFKNFELNLLKKYSCNKNVFNHVTISLMTGLNISKYKNEINELFDYNSFLVKKYKNLIKSLRDNIKINIFREFCQNGLLYYASIKLSKEKMKELVEILENNDIYIDSNKHRINNSNFKITINNKMKDLGKVNKDGLIEINTLKHRQYKINISSTIIHEIFHVYCDEIKIRNVLEKENNDLIELMCEMFINVFLNTISRIQYI